MTTPRLFPLLLCLLLCACVPGSNDIYIRDALVFHASFDEGLRADRGGSLDPRTRFDDETGAGRYVFEDDVDRSVFTIVPQGGVHGGALEILDVLPRNGRVFYPAEGNLPDVDGRRSGTVSLWLRMDPGTMPRMQSSDPLQITERGATDGGLWLDSTGDSPRDLRLGVFPSAGNGREQLAPNSPDAPVVRMREVGFEAGDWHHIACTWANFDSGQNNAWAALYVDGRMVGSINDREITMDWDLARTGIYIGVSYIGLLDELAIFDRPLAADEIRRLESRPGLLSDER